MKLKITLLTALISCPYLLFSQPLFEAKAGYFFFGSHKMRQVYDQGGVDLQLCASYPLYREWLSIAGGVEYIYRTGHSLALHQKTVIQQWPLSLGLRFEPYCFTDYIKWYFTLGPRYFIVRVKNDSSFVPRHMNENGLGGFCNTGLLFTLSKYMTLDLFGEYSYKRLHFHSSKPGAYGQTVQIGGFTFGGGLGCAF